MGSYQNIVNSYGLKSNGNNAIDVVNGVPVRISNYKGNATVYVYAGKDRVRSVIDKIREAAVPYGLRKPAISGEAITFSFKKVKLAVEDYSNIRKIISNNAGILTVDQCPYCMAGYCDVAGMYNSSSARRMHRQCYLNKRNSEMDKIMNSQGNYFTGIIGALLAAILIVAFADLLVLGAEKIYYILYLCFPLFIAGAFRLFKGPYGPVGSFCHVTISVLAMYAYFYVQGCYYASQWYDVSMIEAAQYFPDIMEIILDPEFIRYSALEIILYVVGIIVALLYNPTSKRVGSKMARQDYVFITPLVANAGFGMDNAYGTSNTGYGTDNSAFGTNNTGYGTDNSAFGTNNTGYGTDNSAFGTNTQDFGTDNTGFGAGYDTSQHVR